MMSDEQYLANRVVSCLSLDEFLDKRQRKQYMSFINKFVFNPHHPVKDLKVFCNYLEELVSLLEAFDLSKMDIASIVVNEPSLVFMDKQDIYYKYLMLGVAPSMGAVEDKRKSYIVERPQDLRTSLDIVFARFSLMMELGYELITWSTLLHISELQFAKKFTISTGDVAPHKIFSSVDDVSSAKLLERYPLDREHLVYLKEFDANRDVVMRYENKTPEEKPTF